jgi:hypothetical protein
MGFQQLSTPLSLFHPAAVPGCNLLISPDLIAFLPAIAGVADWQIRLPNTAALAGITLRQQVLVLEFGAGANLAVLFGSNGLMLTVGSL